MEIVHVTTASFEQEVLKAEQKVIVDFFADWCGPCKMLAPILEEIAAQRADVKVCKVNVDEEPDLAAQYKVMSIPMLITFDKGKIDQKSIGYISKEEVEALLA